MKLIGSKIEKSLERSLKFSHNWLFQKPDGEIWKNALLRVDPKLRTAYTLYMTPGESEDFRTFITDKKEIFVIEISRIDPNEPVRIEQIHFQQYKRDLRGRDDNLQLMIVLKLIEKDLKTLTQSEIEKLSTKPDEYKVMYNKEQFGIELKYKVLQKHPICEIGHWACSIYLEYNYYNDLALRDMLLRLNTMEDGPEFALTYEELNQIADDLIAGKDVK